MRYFTFLFPKNHQISCVFCIQHTRNQTSYVSLHNPQRHCEGYFSQDGQAAGLNVFYLNIKYPGSLSRLETQANDPLDICKLVD